MMIVNHIIKKESKIKNRDALVERSCKKKGGENV
jgi:hypothetical protein